MTITIATALQTESRNYREELLTLQDEMQRLSLDLKQLLHDIHTTLHEEDNDSRPYCK